VRAGLDKNVQAGDIYPQRGFAGNGKAAGHLIIAQGAGYLAVYLTYDGAQLFLQVLQGEYIFRGIRFALTRPEAVDLPFLICQLFQALQEVA